MPDQHQHVRFLLVSPNGDCRIVKRRTRSQKDHEVAYRLVVNVPDTFGRTVSGDITVDLPRPPLVDLHPEPTEGN